MTADGIRDVVVSTADGVDYYPRTGATTFSTRTPVLAQQLMSARGLSVADVSGDGYEDVVVASVTTSTLVLVQVVASLTTTQVSFSGTARHFKLCNDVTRAALHAPSDHALLYVPRRRCTPCRAPRRRLAASSAPPGPSRETAVTLGTCDCYTTAPFQSQCRGRRAEASPRAFELQSCRAKVQGPSPCR
jgi:hypothetical protein